MLRRPRVSTDSGNMDTVGVVAVLPLSTRVGKHTGVGVSTSTTRSLVAVDKAAD